MKKQPDPKILNRAYKYVYGLTVVFFVTAVIGALIGKQFDNRFGIAPFGTVGSLLALYLLTWAISKKVLDKFNQSLKKK